MRPWAWAVAGLVGLGALILVVWLRVKGDKSGANHAMADAIDAWAAPSIARAKADLERLQKAANVESAAVAAAQATLDAAKDKLTQRYTVLELPAADVARRFRALQL